MKNQIHKNCLSRQSQGFSRRYSTSRLNSEGITNLLESSEHATGVNLVREQKR